MSLFTDTTISGLIVSDELNQVCQMRENSVCKALFFLGKL